MPHIGVAFEDSILDLHACVRAGLLDETSLLGPTLNQLYGPRPRRSRREVRTRIQRAADARHRRRASRPHARRGDAAADDHRRLHRLLRQRAPRHERRLDVPPRQSAAAELQMDSHRLPRPRVVDRRQRHAGAPPAAARRATMRTRRPRSVPRSVSTTRWSSACSSAAATRSASRSRSATRSSTSSASASSTTGRRATSRPGSTSRSARSWPRTSPRRSRRGS